MPYLDTSALVPLFVSEPKSEAVREALKGVSPKLSQWTLTEYASALAVKARSGVITRTQAIDFRARCDIAIASGLFSLMPTRDHDFWVAENFIHPDKPPLRAGDALHLAICQRLGEMLVTLDREQHMAATAAGVDVLPIQ